MSDSKGSALRQMDKGETDALSLGVLNFHKIRLVPRLMGAHGFECSCGEVFPFSEERLRKHLTLALGEAARLEEATPHPSWGGFAKPGADAPAGSPDWSGLDARQSCEAIDLVKRLAALLRAPGYSVAVGEALVARAEALVARAEAALQHGDRITETIDTGKSTVRVTYTAGGPFDDREPPKVDDDDRPGALVSLSFAQMRLARRLAEAHAEIIDDGRGSRDFTHATDIGIKMRDGMMAAALDLAYEELQDAQRATGTHGEVLDLLDEVMGRMRD